MALSKNRARKLFIRSVVVLGVMFVWGSLAAGAGVLLVGGGIWLARALGIM